MKQIILILVLLALSSTLAQSQQTSWQWINPLPQGNLLNAVYAVNPDTVVAVGEMGTVLRTSNGGTTWQVEHSVAGIEDQFLAISFISGTTGWIVGEYGAVLKTTDAGETWSSQYILGALDLFAVDFVSPTIGWVAGTGGKIFRTIDGGSTWAAETSHTNTTLFGLNFTSQTLGWAVGGNGTILQTTDGGNHWTGSTNGSQTIFSISFSTPSLGFAVGSFGTILRTVNGGSSWTQDTSPTDLSLYGIQFINATTGWAIGSYGVVLKTTNAGTDWFLQSTPTFNDLYGVAFAQNSTSGIAIGDYGTIIRTTDGINWTSITTGIKYELYASYFTNPLHAYVAGDLGTVGVTNDGGKTWIKQNTGTFRPLYGIYFVNDVLGWCVGDSATILRTTNGGASWLEQNSHNDISLYSIYFANSTSGWAVGDFGAVLHTTNQGSTWLPETSDVTSSLLRVKFATPAIGWAVGYNGTIIKTTNGGADWFSQPSNVVFALNAISVLDQNNVTVAGDLGTILSTTNGGTTWISRTSNTDETLYGVSFYNSQIGWAAGDEGTIVGTYDGGVTWSLQPNITVHPFFEIQAVHSSSGGIVVASGYGGTIICSGISPLPLRVWTGALDSSWYNAGNWNPVGVPLKIDSVYIPVKDINPVIRGTDQQIMMGALTIESGAKLTLGSGATNMVVKGNVLMSGTFECEPAAHTEILVGGNFLTNFNGQFIPGGSTVVFTAPGLVKGTFNNLVLSTNSLMQTTGNITVTNNLDIFSNLVLRAIDTLTILNPDPAALEGPGIVTAGTIKRAIQQGSTSTYRFESAVSFIQFYPTGTLPETITITVFPNTLPPGLPDTLFARRMYAVKATGGGNYLSYMSLRYELSESNISIDNLSLFRDTSGILFNMGRYDFLDSDLVALSLDSVRNFSNWYFGQWDYYPRRPYEFLESLYITNGQNLVDTLLFGAEPDATSGFDPAWGEVPAGPLPPLNIFDTRWTLPSSEQTQTDIRGLLSSSDQEHVYSLDVQPGTNGLPFSIQWSRDSLPIGTLFIRDRSTHGGLLNVNMKMDYVLLATTSNLTALEIVHKIPTFFDFNSGWNMISLPLIPANDARRVTTFPSAASEAFGFDGSTYFPEETLHVGRGYWIRFTLSQTIGLEGTPQSVDSIPVLEGWNLIGAGTTPVLKSSLVQVPPGIIASNFFQYQNGYILADTLQPAKAFWVKVSASGKLVLHSSATLPKEAVQDAASEDLRKMNTLIIADRSGNHQALYFGSLSSINNKKDFYQMPPTPPVGAFDARFSTGSAVSVGNKNHISDIIRLQSTSYPVKISWDFHQQYANAITLRDLTNGKVLYHSESGLDGSYDVKDPAITKVGFSVEMQPTVPQIFSLKQNYPNPFNPTTSISFDLPIDARVSIRVYNILGQEIASLLDNQKYTAGTHSTIFNATNVGSGVYFYQCIAHADDGREFIESKKMLLLR